MVLILRIIFIALAGLAISGGTLSLWKGSALPGVNAVPELDNVYRFMAGMYLGTGIICLWMAYTLENQGALVYLMALTVFLAGTGRCISLSLKGISNKKFYLYTVAELVLAMVITLLQYMRMN